jgi:DNA-binding transcriptional regulator LsrR (DeoR family)
MGKRFDVDRLGSKYLLKYQQLMYEIARLFVDENLNYSEIPEKIYEWAKNNAEQYYDKNGTNNIHRGWVKKQIELIKKEHQFITLGKFRENELSREIKQRISGAQDVSLEIAPNDNLLLRQVCLGFDEILIEKLASTTEGEEIVIGVSGGQTMLALAQTLHDIKTQMEWNKIASNDDKNRVVVCSLTSGGTRDNISALSDTVAANIAQELGVKAKGLLGPPSFKDVTAHDAFNDEPEVQKHIQLVQKAGIILTSVGNVHDDISLTSQIFNVIDHEYLSKIRKERKHLGDILYQCYDGYTGEIISHSKEIIDRIFLVIKLAEIRRRIREHKTRCIIVAKGYEKGKHALRGAILSRIASDIYMDINCAQGLNDICKQT